MPKSLEYFKDADTQAILDSIMIASDIAKLYSDWSEIDLREIWQYWSETDFSKYPEIDLSPISNLLNEWSEIDISDLLSELISIRTLEPCKNIF